ARQRQRRGESAGLRQPGDDGRDHADPLPARRLLRLRADALPRPGGRGRARRAAAAQRAARPGALGGGDRPDRPRARRLRHVRAAGDGRRRRPGPEPDRRAGRRAEEARGAGDRAAVAVHLPLPVARRAGERAARAARPHRRRAPRHLARRRPLVLGLRARREGGREPRRRQRRLRGDEGASRLPRPLRRAVRTLARLHVQQRPGGRRRRLLPLGGERAEELRPGRQVHARVLAHLPARAAEEGWMTTMAATLRAPLWRRLVGFNLLTAIVLGVGGWYAGWFGARAIVGPSLDYFADVDYNELSVFLAYLGGVVGFLAGLGFLNYPLARLRGYPPSLREKETEGIGRYFSLCTDHKVVGIQYLWGIGLFFFIGGLNAMLIRFELLRPNHQAFPAGTYLTLVGLHGTMMMGMMTSGILGPFGNYLVPIMIGARRMAFPRIEALTFWLLMAAGVILETTIFFGGFPTGWTGYQPLGTQANPGMDCYYLFFALVG